MLVDNPLPLLSPITHCPHFTDLCCVCVCVCADMEAVSSMQTSGWPPCVSHGQPHLPTSLVLAQIIPANGESAN